MTGRRGGRRLPGGLLLGIALVGAAAVRARAGEAPVGKAVAAGVAASAPADPSAGMAFVTASSIEPDGSARGHLWAFPLDRRRGGLSSAGGVGELDSSRALWDAAGRLPPGAFLHGAPALVGGPNSLFFFQRNVARYPAFARRLHERRPALFAGASDGFLRAFDAGTGAELFAYAPRGAAGGRAGVDGAASFDDVYIDAPWAGGGEPCPAALSSGGRNCQWRTVLAGGLGNGGKSIYALDVTRPDSGTGHGAVPDCLTGTKIPEGCSGPYPSILWEFTDTADADHNGRADLANTWSAPSFGRVRLRDSAGRPEERFVVVFGGGYDPDDLVTAGGRRVHGNRSGNWIYMVDAGTGALVWKTNRGVVRNPGASAAVPRPFASIPSAVTLLDLDEDGFIDTAYFGDANGQLFRLSFPEADPVRPADLMPVLLFDGTAGARGLSACSETLPGRPAAGCGAQNAVFHPPVVLRAGVSPSTRRPLYAVAWGTGDESDPSPRGGTGGRFLCLFDDAGRRGAPVPEARTLAGLQRIANPAIPSLAICASSEAFRPEGWALELTSDERVASDVLALGGYFYFTTSAPTRRNGPPAASRPAGDSTARFYRLAWESGDACRGADCCEAPGRWGTPADDRGAGFPGAARLLSAPFAFVDANGLTRVGVVGSGMDAARKGLLAFDRPVGGGSALRQWTSP